MSHERKYRKLHIRARSSCGGHNKTRKKDSDTHLDASNPKGTMLFFSFLPSFLLLLPQLLLLRKIKKTTAAISG
jgi:hypothetical protein